MAHWTDPLKQLTEGRDEAEATKAFVQVLSFVPEYKGQLRGHATLKFFDCLVVKGIRLLEGAKGPYLGMPERQTANGFEAITFLTTPEMREMVTGLVKDFARYGQRAIR
jgi:DNA-binding cell septation regulator SpoVG